MRNSPEEKSPSFARPQPRLDSKYQPGISDPQWPESPPTGVVKEADFEQYLLKRAGRIDPQKFLSAMFLDVNVNSQKELHGLLRDLSSFAQREMKRKPDETSVPVLEEIPESWRVTVTIGFGTQLFLTAEGTDRFGLLEKKPKWLATMRKTEIDDFEPSECDTDLILLIASDHTYVNLSMVRRIAEGNWLEPRCRDPRLRVQRIEHGYTRPDLKEYLGSDDGADNLSNSPDHDLDRLVYVRKEDGEPNWCLNGSYLFWKKIRENMGNWIPLSDRKRSEIIGRDIVTDKPLTATSTGRGGMTPVFTYPPMKDMVLCHIQKVQPRRPGVDFCGISDLDRRFLRRAYPYFEELESPGEVSLGRLFFAFMRALGQQAEWAVQIWQSNPDFPVKGVGVDPLFSHHIAATLAGGHYFMPPAPSNGEEFVGAAMFS